MLAGFGKCCLLTPASVGCPAVRSMMVDVDGYGMHLPDIKTTCQYHEYRGNLPSIVGAGVSIWLRAELTECADVDEFRFGGKTLSCRLI